MIRFFDGDLLSLVLQSRTSVLRPGQTLNPFASAHLQLHLTFSSPSSTPRSTFPTSPFTTAHKALLRGPRGDPRPATRVLRAHVGRDMKIHLVVTQVALPLPSRLGDLFAGASGQLRSQKGGRWGGKHQHGSLDV